MSAIRSCAAARRAGLGWPPHAAALHAATLVGALALLVLLLPALLTLLAALLLLLAAMLGAVTLLVTRILLAALVRIVLVGHCRFLMLPQLVDQRPGEAAVPGRASG